jgi:dihydrofolate synthase/folylpolyglutamate synthase
VAKRPHPSDWLDGFVVASPPRGEIARQLARALVDELGSPQRHAPAVHIVGTAGKGSVAARLTTRLVAGGYRVATHQSPHVYDVRERFLLDGKLPAWDLVDAAIDEIDDAVANVVRTCGRAPTYFAVTAALSWVLGRRHDVDVFVTEAGIGGRHDATAVLDRSDTLTVITHIGLDHIEVLGPTVDAIATEKAAVLSGREVAVLGPQASDRAVEVVRGAATTAGVTLHEVRGAYPDWRAAADATVDVVAPLLAGMLGRAVPEAEPEPMPGRYEVRSVADRRVVLDGAHNPDKLAALDIVLAGDVRPRCVIAGLGTRKDLSAGAAVLARLGGPVVAVGFGDRRVPAPSGWAPADLVDAIVAAGGSAEASSSPADAVRRALACTESGDTIVVTGSFLILAPVAEALAGELRRSPS